MRNETTGDWVTSHEVETTLRQLKQVARDGCFICTALLKHYKDREDDSVQAVSVLRQLLMDERDPRNSTLSSFLVSYGSGTRAAVLSSVYFWFEKIEAEGDALAIACYSFCKLMVTIRLCCTYY
jgi:hypothetical protein